MFLWPDLLDQSFANVHLIVIFYYHKYHWYQIMNQPIIMLSVLVLLLKLSKEILLFTSDSLVNLYQPVSSYYLRSKIHKNSLFSVRPLFIPVIFCEIICRFQLQLNIIFKYISDVLFWLNYSINCITWILS